MFALSYFSFLAALLKYCFISFLYLSCRKLSEVFHPKINKAINISLLLRWCRARDLFGSQIPVTAGGFPSSQEVLNWGWAHWESRVGCVSS